MVKLELNGTEIKYEQWKFPGGEIGIKVPLPIDPDGYYKVSILGLVQAEDLITALNLCDAYGIVDELYIPYFPYGRQDRVCHEGESFSLRVFCKLIISASNRFKKLTILDPHSDVIRQELSEISHKLNLIGQWKLTKALPNYDCIIAPDLGASVKANLTQSTTQHIFLEKTRTKNGIVYLDYPTDTIKGNVCVVDDICDGGATFLELAKMLEKTQPNIESLSLYVTHGIFSKGCFALAMHYNTLYCVNLMNPDVDHLVTVLPYDPKL